MGHHFIISHARLILGKHLFEAFIQNAESKSSITPPLHRLLKTMSATATDPSSNAMSETVGWDEILNCPPQELLYIAGWFNNPLSSSSWFCPITIYFTNLDFPKRISRFPNLLPFRGPKNVFSVAFFNLRKDGPIASRESHGPGITQTNMKSPLKIGRAKKGN